MRPVPHLERIINKKMRLPPDRTYQSSTLKAGPRRMNTWILDTAIARLLSTNAVVLTEPPNAQMVGYPDVIQIGICGSVPTSWLRGREHPSGIFQSEVVVHRLVEPLLATEIALSCLNRCVSKQELNLVKFS